MATAARLQNAFERWRWWLYAGVLIAAAPLPYFAARLHTDNAIERWLDPTHPAAADYARVVDEFHIGDFILLAVDDCPSNDPRLERLAQQFESSPAVAVCWTPERVRDMQRMLSGSSKVADDQLLVPLVDRRDRQHVAALLIMLDPQQLRDRRSLLDRFQRSVLALGFDRRQVRWGGPSVINVALDRRAEASLRGSLPLATGIMFVLLCLLLKRISFALAVLLCSGLSTLATLALMAVMGHPLNLLLVALPPMILVLNLSYGIHLVWRWQTAADRTTALGQAVLHTYGPSLLAAATTALGAVSLVSSRLLPVRLFGIWAAVGTLAALAVTYAYLPTALVDQSSPRRSIGRWSWPTWQPNMVRAVALVTLLVGGIAAVGLLRIETEANALNFLPANGTTRADYRRIESRLTGLLPVDVVLETPADWPWAKRIEYVRQSAARLRACPELDTVVCLPDFLRPRAERAGEQAAALLEDAEYRRSTRALLNPEGTRWRILATVPSHRSSQLLEIVDGLKQQLPPTATVTGLVPLIMAAQTEVFRGLLSSFLLAMVLLVPVLSLVLRSVVAALVAMVPNVLPIIVGFGLVGLAGRPVDAATLLTASIALGVALDDSMHLIAAFRRAARHVQRTETLDPLPAAAGTLSAQPARRDVSNARIVSLALSDCAVPMIATTCIAGLGLGVLAASPFAPVAHFGGLLAGLLLLALVCDLAVLPSLLSTRLGDAFLRRTQPAETPHPNDAPRPQSFDLLAEKTMPEPLDSGPGSGPGANPSQALATRHQPSGPSEHAPY